MSRYSGRQGRGASRLVRKLKREQATLRKAVYDVTQATKDLFTTERESE